MHSQHTVSGDSVKQLPMVASCFHNNGAIKACRWQSDDADEHNQHSDHDSFADIPHLDNSLVIETILRVLFWADNWKVNQINFYLNIINATPVPVYLIKNKLFVPISINHETSTDQLEREVEAVHSQGMEQCPAGLQEV